MRHIGYVCNSDFGVKELSKESREPGKLMLSPDKSNCSVCRQYILEVNHYGYANQNDSG